MDNVRFIDHKTFLKTPRMDRLILRFPKKKNQKTYEKYPGDFLDTVWVYENWIYTDVQQNSDENIPWKSYNYLLSLYIKDKFTYLGELSFKKLFHSFEVAFPAILLSEILFKPAGL